MLRELTERQRANISAWMRDRPGVILYQEDLPGLLKLPTPSVQERANRLLLDLERRSDFAGRTIDIPRSEQDAAEFIGVCGAATLDELIYLAHTILAEGEGYLKITSSTFGALSVSITSRGYSHLQELRATVHETRIGFCAMWFDVSTEVTWTQAIERAISSAGYEPKRMDRHEHNNRIDDEIIALLRRSKFLVADFTGQRGGVYFEAGFALGLGRQVIWTVREDELSTVHFDNRQYNFITWRPEDLSTFQFRLQNRIEATIGPGPLKSAT